MNEPSVFIAFDPDAFAKSMDDKNSSFRIGLARQKQVRRKQAELERALDRVDRSTIRIQVALYEGKSFFPSRLIRWITWGDKSHAAWHYPSGVILPPKTEGGNRELCFGHDAWHPNGVRRLKSLDDGHSKGTKVMLYNIEVTQEQLFKLVMFNESQMGKKYNWLGVFEFPPVIRFFLTLFARKYMKQDPMDLPSWFCSCLVLCGSIAMGLPFLVKDPRKTSPEDLESSPALYYSGKPEEYVTK
jgi:hypothetical protein